MTPRSHVTRVFALLLSLFCLALPALPALAAGEKTLPAYAVPDRSLSAHKALTVRYGRICPYCGSGNTFLVTGNEYNSKEIEAC